MLPEPAVVQGDLDAERPQALDALQLLQLEGLDGADR